MSTSHWLESLLDHPVPLLLRQSADAAALALALGLIVLGLRHHLSAAWRHGLWLVVFARLLLPGLPVVPMKAVPRMPVPAALRSNMAAPASIARPPATSPAATIAASLPPAPLMTSVAHPTPALPMAIVHPMWSPALIIWWLVAALMLGMGAWRSVSLHFRLLRGSRPAPPEVEKWLQEVGHSHGLRRVPEIMVCSAVQVPALAGWWQPRILLPEGFVEGIGEDRLRLVMGHELAHWRRHDLWWQLFAGLLLAVHWFNPLLWIARYRLREEAEAACDEWLLARIGHDQARVYGDTLLQVGGRVPVHSRRWIPGAQGMLGMAIAASGVRRRILLVTDWMRGRRASRWAGLAGLGVVAALGFLRGAEPKAEVKPASPSWRDHVQFHVFDDVSKAPIEGVKLMVESDKYHYESMTDAEGQASVQLPAARPAYTVVRVRRQGRVPLVVHWHFAQPSFQPPEVLELPLPKAVSVGGVVLATDGKPVAKAQIALIMRGANMGEATQEIFPDIWERRVPTDGQGRWSFNEAPPGRRWFSLAVEHPEIVRQSVLVDEKNVRSFYQGNGRTEVRRGFKITGTVVGDSGQPVKKARLVWSESGSGTTTFPEYQTDDQGQFVITNAPPGVNELVTVFAQDWAPCVLRWNVKELKQPVTIRMNKGSHLRVRVVDAGDRPVEGVIAAADQWHGPGAGDRGVRVMENRFRTGKDGRFTWEHAPFDEVSWDFFGARGFRDSRGVRITPGDKEVIVKLRPVLGLHGLVTDADTGEPIPEFRVTPGDSWEAEGSKQAAHGGWSWWRPGTLIGRRGQLSFESDRDTNPLYHRVLRISAPGYAPVISDPLDDPKTSRTWNVALKKTPPTQVKIIQPDGTPAPAAKLALSGVRHGSVRVQHGDLPGPEGTDGDDTVLIADSKGIVGVPPEIEGFDVVAVHASGWDTLKHADLHENAVLQLQPWAGVEVDLSGLPPDLRSMIQIILSPVILDGSSIDQRTEEKDMSAQREGYRDDHLTPGLYKLQLSTGSMFTTPLPIRLKPGEHRKIDAVALWQWCQPTASLEVPQGVKIDRLQDDLRIMQIDEDVQGRVPQSIFDSSHVMNVAVSTQPSANGGWKIQMGFFGLGAGRYHLTGRLKGWPASVATTEPARGIGKIDCTFTIPQSAVGPGTMHFENNPRDPLHPQLKIDGLPEFVLPAVRVE